MQWDSLPYQVIVMVRHVQISSLQANHVLYCIKLVIVGTIYHAVGNHRPQPTRKWMNSLDRSSLGILLVSSSERVEDRQGTLASKGIT